MHLHALLYTLQHSTGENSYFDDHSVWAFAETDERTERDTHMMQMNAEGRRRFPVREYWNKLKVSMRGWGFLKPLLLVFAIGLSCMLCMEVAAAEKSSCGVKATQAPKFVPPLSHRLLRIRLCFPLYIGSAILCFGLSAVDLSKYELECKETFILKTAEIAT